MTRDDRFDQPPWVVDEIVARRRRILVRLNVAAVLIGVIFWITLPVVGAAILLPAVAALVVTFHAA